MRLTMLAAALFAPVAASAQDHAGHVGHVLPDRPVEQPADPHAGHTMPQASDPAIGSAPPPEPPHDHAADALFDPAAMASAREALYRESGGMTFSMIRLDLAEVQVREGRDGYRWQGEAWVGGDRDRAMLKYEGEGEIGGALESAEVQVLYTRALDPWWNLAAGVRHDFRPGPQRTYAVVGVEGLAPYWFHLSAAAFLSDKGDAHFRAEGSHDIRLTQRAILQPRVELNLALQDVPALGIGSGLSDVELGLRLRYELRREFAPYLGVEWNRKTGDTARFARALGDDPDTVSLVAGVRLWF
jgi:copper resistance protein B